MTEDTLTQAGATKLARKLEQYWALLGHAVDCRVERIKDGGEHIKDGLGTYQVRSNIDVRWGAPGRRA